MRRSMLCLILAGVLAAPMPVSAQTRQLPPGSEMTLGQPGAQPGFQVRVRSWVEIPFRTVVHQEYDFSCGSAAVATLMTYQYGVPLSETAAFKSMWDHGDQARIRRFGFSLLDMKNYLIRIGYPAEGYKLTMDDLATIDRPLIALATVNGYRHFVIVKGVQGNDVMLGDPARGLTRATKEEFAKMWSGIALVIMGDAKDGQPTFNLARDWRPWTAPPSKIFQGQRSIASITDNMPPIYQIRPDIAVPEPIRIGVVP